jgi:hypothetical protein
MAQEEVKEGIQESKKSWRCFHCDEIFTDFAEAEMHFGRSCMSNPVCIITAVELRDMENQLNRYREEDTQLHRELRQMESNHATALRREEEKGYARGLQDARYMAINGKLDRV